MTTRAEIRRLLTDFRDMVRARGPGECLQVATMLTCYTVSDPQPEANWLFASAARHALRWWRWDQREKRRPHPPVLTIDCGNAKGWGELHDGRIITFSVRDGVRVTVTTTTTDD